MNLPNKLTMLRIILIPVFLVLLLVESIPLHYLWSLIVYLAACFTDTLDGYLARSRNLVTDFGKLMDPLADKILVISALVCMASLGLTNAWFVIIIVAREFLVTSIRLLAVESGTVIPANNWGKAKTVSQMVAIIAVLALQYVLELHDLGLVAFADPAALGRVFLLVGNGLLAVAVVLTLISGATYVVQNRGLFADK